jgi:hypothetical protein
MTKFLIISILIIFLSSCKWNCDKERQADFILKCAEAANPKSDEEGEDLVMQCEKTSRNLFCSLN